MSKKKCGGCEYLGSDRFSDAEGGGVVYPCCYYFTIEEDDGAPKSLDDSLFRPVWCPGYFKECSYCDGLGEEFIDGMASGECEYCNGTGNVNIDPVIT